MHWLVVTKIHNQHRQSTHACYHSLMSLPSFIPRKSGNMKEYYERGGYDGANKNSIFKAKETTKLTRKKLVFVGDHLNKSKT